MHADIEDDFKNMNCSAVTDTKTIEFPVHMSPFLRTFER